MKKITQIFAIIISLFFTTMNLHAYMINDNYWGADDHGWGDIIGTPSYFDISKMDVNLDNGKLTVDIFTTYVNHRGIYDTQLGDFFISTNGWNPFGSANYLGDSASNGENWEYAAVINNRATETNGSLSVYAIGDGTIINSYGPSGSIWRNGQEVLFNPNNGVSTIGQNSTWEIIDLNNTNYDILRLIINGEGAFSGVTNFGFHWGMTCANDVIEGAAPVPEPGTMLLLGTGLVGLIGFGRKKFLKRI